MYVGVTTDKETFFASDEWCTIPFLKMKKTTSDRLNDIMLKIPECLDLRNKLLDERKNGSPSLPATADALAGKAQWLVIRLQEYWKEYGNDIDPDYEWDQYQECSNFQTAAESWTITTPHPVHFRTKAAAKIVAEFDAGIVILYSILQEIYMDSAKEYEKPIAVHCASTLEAAAFLEKLGVDSGGSTAMVFPLKTVHLCTPLQQQADNSAMELAKWGKTRGLEGVCKLWRDSF